MPGRVDSCSGTEASLATAREAMGLPAEQLHQKKVVTQADSILLWLWVSKCWGIQLFSTEVLPEQLYRLDAFQLYLSEERWIKWLLLKANIQLFSMWLSAGGWCQCREITQSSPSWLTEWHPGAGLLTLSNRKDWILNFSCLSLPLSALRDWQMLC